MDSWITPEVEEIILREKSYMPKTFRMQTMETDHHLIIRIIADNFSDFSVNEKVRIAEGVNSIREQIKKLGCPVEIVKY